MSRVLHGYYPGNYPGNTRTLHLCAFCTPMEKYPGYGYTLVKYPGTGTTTTLYTIRDTFVRSAPHPYNTRYLCWFCKKLVRVPDTFVSSVLFHTNMYPNFCELCNISYIFTFYTVPDTFVRCASIQYPIPLWVL